MVEEWKNWSGAVECRPRAIVTPGNEDEVIALVRRANSEGLTLRATGSGHSFVPLCASDGILISLDNLKGVVSADRKSLRATIRAGSKLYEIGEPLRLAGLSMENLGDIDRQSLAGAISTGTHGTGHGICNLSNQVVALRLVTADGESLDCSAERDSEIFKSAQVSLGALGIITQVRLRLVPAYRLHEKTWRVPVDECFKNLERLIHENRHFEFFWYPKRDECAMKTLNPTSKSQEDLQGAEGERIGPSDKIFPTERNIKFNETEFSIPEAKGPECFFEIRRLMQTKHDQVAWPVEYRTLGADDIYLSPAYRRDTVTISVHQGNTLPYKEFFSDVEGIFRKYEGRPHWGKIHTHSARELRLLYPMWEVFQKVRKQLDPKGLFLNEHLRQILL